MLILLDFKIQGKLHFTKNSSSLALLYINYTKTKGCLDWKHQVWMQHNYCKHQKAREQQIHIFNLCLEHLRQTQKTQTESETPSETSSCPAVSNMNSCKD